MTIVGIGVDLEPVASFRRKKFSRQSAFYRRLFSDVEMDYCAKFRDPAPHLAARFCAKEAFVKATRPILRSMVTDVEVKNESDGAPFLRPRTAKSSLKRLFRTHQIMVSLSHSEDHAIAFVLLAKGNERGGR